MESIDHILERKPRTKVSSVERHTSILTRNSEGSRVMPITFYLFSNCLDLPLFFVARLFVPPQLHVTSLDAPS